MINTAHLESDANELASLYAQLREAQAEAAWLRAALTDAVMTVGQSRKSHLGDHYSYCPQISEQRLEKWRGVLAKPHSVSPSVTNRENAKQPQCGHPRAAIVSSDEGTQYCAWCEEVAQARAEGVAAEQKQIYAAVFQIIQEWRYALVDGNSAGEPVPRNIVGDILDCIELAARGAAAIRSAEEAQE